MSTRFIGLTAAACGAVGAVATLRRLRTLALIPRIFIKSDRGGTVPASEPGNLRTAFAVALLWGMDKLVARLLRGGVIVAPSECGVFGVNMGNVLWCYYNRESVGYYGRSYFSHLR